MAAWAGEQSKSGELQGSAIVTNTHSKSNTINFHSPSTNDITLTILQERVLLVADVFHAGFPPSQHLDDTIARTSFDILTDYRGIDSTEAWTDV